MMPSDTEWNLVLDRLKAKLGDDVFGSWFNDMKLQDDDRQNVITLGFPTPFIQQYAKDNFGTTIQEICEQVFSNKPRVGFAVDAHAGTDQSRAPAFRAVPDTDRQQDMFIPDITELPIKDDVHLMEIAPFTLQPRGETRNELHFDNVNGVNIHIKANPNYGLITALDYDLVLMMQSWLAEIANEYRRNLKLHKAGKGPAPKAPPRYFQPHVKEILLFSRNYQAAGDNQRERVEGMLNRLKNTEVKIAKAGRQRRRWGTFSFIHDWDILEEKKSGKILQVRIEIPGWIYSGIVEAPVPTILTYDPDYFLLKKSFMKFLYRLCRLYDHKLDGLVNEHSFLTTDLHKRSQSKQAMKEFNRELKANIKSLDDGQFFKWSLSIDGQRDMTRLIIKTTNENQGKISNMPHHDQ